MKRMFASFGAAALIMAGSALAGSAFVRVQGGPPGGYQLLAANVPYGDLDISTPGGAQTLLERIDAAALQVCGAKAGKRPAFVDADKFEACRTRAVADAVKTVQSPTLAQVAAAH